MSLHPEWLLCYSFNLFSRDVKDAAKVRKLFELQTYNYQHSHTKTIIITGNQMIIYSV